jgi:alcohol dehydrogenase class IV
MSARLHVRRRRVQQHGIGLAHAISAPLGAQHHVIHGLGNALALPAVTAFNEPEIPQSKRNWLMGMMDTRSVTEGVCRLRDKIDLDIGLEDCLPADANYSDIAEAAMRSGNIQTTARTPELKDVETIITAMRKPLCGNMPAL